MAAGDKLYLADKATLDNTYNKAVANGTAIGNVKSVVDSTKTIVEGINTNVNLLKNSQGGRPYFTVSDLTNNKLVMKSMNLGANTTVLNLTGSGFLYMAAFLVPYNNTTGNNVVSARVVLDGTNIVSRSFNHSSYSNPLLFGHLSKDAIVDLNHYLALPEASIYTSNTGAAGSLMTYGGLISTLSTNIQSGILYTIKPIRFNSSIVISGGSNIGALTAYYIYELD